MLRMTDADLHDHFEPSSDWREHLMRLEALEGLIENEGAWVRKYLRARSFWDA